MGGSPVEEIDSGEGHQKWVGKDYYNPFIRDFEKLEEPFASECQHTCWLNCTYTATQVCMPWGTQL